MRLLDTFCKAGGATKGYQMAGFEVVGVDIEPQPHYCGDAFIEADALDVLYALAHGDCWPDQSGRDWHLEDFDIIHASPPCQAYSALRHLRPEIEYPDLIVAVRESLRVSGRPFIIENVPKAPLNCPIMLCGSAFGLRVRRHRLFESTINLKGQMCNHKAQGRPIDVSGTGGRRINRRPNDHGGSTNKPLNLLEARVAMGIDWMTRSELSQAIPPAYTEFIGKQLLKAIGAKP